MILVMANGDDGIIINYQPQRLNKTEEELREMGALFENEPVPEMIEGKDPVLKFDGTNLFYEYVDIPPTLSDEMQQLQTDMGNILFENATDKSRIYELELSQGDLLMEIALLKMGGSA